MRGNRSCNYPDCDEWVDKDHKFCHIHGLNRVNAPHGTRCEQWRESWNKRRGIKERFRCSHLATVALQPKVVNHDVFMCEHCARYEVSTGRMERLTPIRENKACTQVPRPQLMSLKIIRRKLIEELSKPIDRTQKESVN